MRKFNILFEYNRTTTSPNSAMYIIEAENVEKAKSIVNRKVKKDIPEPTNFSFLMDIEEIDTTPRQQSLI